MPIARGTIDKKRKNDCGFQLDDGNWYSRLDGPPIPELQAWKDNNVTIEVEWTQDGQWKNFKNNPTAVQQEESAADQSTGGKGWFGKKGFGPTKSFNKNGNAGGYKKMWHAYEDYDYQVSVGARITRQNALNNAISLVTASKIDKVNPDTVDLVTTVADLFVEWVEGGEE